MLASDQWWNFVPYTICVEKCPEKFTIVDSTKYGGCNYAGVEAGSGACKEADHPTYYAAFKTKQMLRRCFPVLEKAEADERVASVRSRRRASRLEAKQQDPPT